MTLAALVPLVCLAPLLPAAIALVNLVTFRRGARERVRVERVSVLIPARNEVRNIGAAIASALAEGASVVEVVVYSDGSTDGTDDVVRELAKRDSRVRLVRGTGELPAGWVGKPHACHSLFAEAKGELLLFMDADVRLERGGVERMLGLHDSGPRAAVVTAVPRQLTGSFFERLVLPLLTLTYVSWLPLRLVEIGRDPRTVAANGQLLSIRHEHLAMLGGFSAVRAEIVDDVAFCRRAKEAGLVVSFIDGFLVGRCRMYESAGAVVRGFSKNLYEGLGSPALLVFVVALYFVSFVFPYVMLALALAGSVSSAWLAPAALGVCINVGLRAILAVRYRQPAEGILLHPLSVLVLIGIALNSYRWHTSGRVSWAGRIYPSRNRRLDAKLETGAGP